MDRPNIATLYEVTQLEAERRKAVPQPAPTPEGCTLFRQAHDMDRWRDRRIDYLKSRLLKARGRLHLNMSSDFERGD